MLTSRSEFAVGISARRQGDHIQNQDFLGSSPDKHCDRKQHTHTHTHISELAWLNCDPGTHWKDCCPAQPCHSQASDIIRMHSPNQSRSNIQLEKDTCQQTKRRGTGHFPNLLIYLIEKHTLIQTHNAHVRIYWSVGFPWQENSSGSISLFAFSLLLMEYQSKFTGKYSNCQIIRIWRNLLIINYLMHLATLIMTEK